MVILRARKQHREMENRKGYMQGGLGCWEYNYNGCSSSCSSSGNSSSSS